jgi:hypothetical protein
MDIPDSGTIEIEVTSHSNFEGGEINGRFFSTNQEERDKWIYDCFKNVLKKISPSGITLTNYLEILCLNSGEEYEDYKSLFFNMTAKLFPSVNNSEIDTYTSLYGLDYLKQSMVND